MNKKKNNCIMNFYKMGKPKMIGQNASKKRQMSLQNCAKKIEKNNVFSIIQINYYCRLYIE